MENRGFQRRAVRYLAREAGIRQFLDIGTGIPAPDKTAYLDADLREPETILSSPDLLSTLDLREPVGLLLIAIMHFIVDEDDPYRLVSTIRQTRPVPVA